MPKHSGARIVYRIIDANLNRAKEGLRVCEEVARFILNNKSLTTKFKRVRHDICEIANSLPLASLLLKERESVKDTGKDIYINELKRKNFQDIFFANIQRVKESIRVLEEFSKLLDKNPAIRFKNARYRIYQIEKEASQEISSTV